MSGRVLLIDDIAANRAMIRAKLASAYYDVLTADTAEEAVDIVRTDHPSVVLIDIMMPTVDAFDLCRRLKSDPQTALTPIIMMTSVEDGPDRIRALEAGADDFLVKPIHELALFARVRNLMRMKFVIDELQLRAETTRELGLEPDETTLTNIDLTPAHSVLIVPPDRETGTRWSALIRDNLSVQTLIAIDEQEVARRVADDIPDAFLIHETPQHGGGLRSDGLRIISTIARRQPTRHSAILMAMADVNMRQAAKGLDLGAWDYLVAPHDPTEMTVRLRTQLRRKLYSDRLRSNLRDGLRMAAIDPLTGLYNRRYADHHLKNMLAQAEAEGTDLAVLILDLDRFKTLNDRYGHEAGDRVLHQVARRLQENVRGVDVVVRLGGEEFCVALPGADRAGAMEVAERIRVAVSGTAYDIGQGRTVRCSMSIGVAVAQRGEDTVESLMRQADLALYRAKDAGRDCIRTAWDAEAPPTA
ncbi:diguanylate cyclase [Roseobacter sp. HKCCA0434]|uniref:diguanylate cyclase n=1 Tax=Roseobacter sp. HKCCA0434 TaxID=3079297 RepID=UPI002905B40F|nr:diguanylate cyclase [Roseobacter sp. HKCCA0434]